MQDHVILVTPEDEPIGTAEKLSVHLTGQLHRAFSLFVFNANNELMLQRRALHKYHSAGLLSNTCCSHPRPGESTDEAVNRRLIEEMGFSCPNERVFGFVYQAELENDLTEHEYDHVYIGQFDGEPNINPDEVAEWQWMDIEAIRDDMARRPAAFTVWFRTCFERVIQAWQGRQSSSLV